MSCSNLVYKEFMLDIYDTFHLCCVVPAESSAGAGDMTLVFALAQVTLGVKRCEATLAPDEAENLAPGELGAAGVGAGVHVATLVVVGECTVCILLTKKTVDVLRILKQSFLGKVSLQNLLVRISSSLISQS